MRCCTHSSGSDPTWGGRWGEEEQRDVGGITWQTTLGWGRRRKRRRKCDNDNDYNDDDNNGYEGGGHGGGDGHGGGRGGEKGKRFVWQSSS